MSSIERRRNLLHNAESALNIHLVAGSLQAFQLLSEVFAFNEFHRQEVDAFLFAVLINRDNVVVFEGSDCARFSLEALHQGLIAFNLILGENFYSSLTLELI